MPGSITSCTDFFGATHAYCYATGWHPEDIEHMAGYWQASQTLRVSCKSACPCLKHPATQPPPCPLPLGTGGGRGRLPGCPLPLPAYPSHPATQPPPCPLPLGTSGGRGRLPGCPLPLPAYPSHPAFPPPLSPSPACCVAVSTASWPCPADPTTPKPLSLNFAPLRRPHCLNPSVFLPIPLCVHTHSTW